MRPPSLEAKSANELWRESSGNIISWLELLVFLGFAKVLCFD